MRSSLQEFESHQATRYKALTEQIEDLLPGATSAGLASAYTTLRNSFDDQIRTMTTVFYVCIAALVGVAVYSSVETVWSPTEGFWVLRTYTDWEMTLRGVVSRLPIYGPAVWLAYFASKRRSEAQRLQQEYAHKEAVAKSYISYKKQLDELEEEGTELRRQLLSSTIETIVRNASTTLDGRHGDKSPAHEAIEALGKIVKDPDLKTTVVKLLGGTPGQN